MMELLREAGADGADLADTEAATWWHTWRPHAGFVASVVSRTVSRSDLVADALQEVWLQLWLCRRTFRAESRARTWAYQVARWRALNVVRDSRTRQRYEGLSARQHILACEAPPARDPFLLSQLLAACDRLPDRQRLVFLRHALLDHSHEEIARDLGISSGTSRSQLSKARASLRADLAHLALEPERPCWVA